MKIFHIAVIITCVALFNLRFFAQEKTVMRYNYQGTLKTSKIEPEKTEETVFVLDIDSLKASRFMEKDLLERKLAIAKAKTKEEGMSAIYGFRPKTNFIVFYTNEMLNIQALVGFNTYEYTTNAKDLVWQIVPGVAQWNDFAVQKATTFYEGRNWTVLFTRDIPLIEGPYVFKNLPGFVVKAWDEDNIYGFELLNSEKVVVDNWEFKDPKKESIEVTQNQYEKALKMHRSKTLRESLEGSGISIGGLSTDKENRRFKEENHSIYKVD